MRLAAGSACAALLALAVPAAAQTLPPPGAEEAARVALIAAVKRSVVHVRSTRKPGSRPADPLDALQRMVGKDPRQPEQGSGFVIDSARGLVITAAHIIDQAQSVDVLGVDGVARPATIERIDPARGYALLRVAGLTAPALALADRSPQAGERALLVGWMLPDRALLAIDSMVMGTISFDREKVGPDASTGPYVALGAALPGGSFGGAPVVDSAGRAVGMVAAIYGQGFGPGSITLMLPLAPLAAAIGTSATR